jgi:hypothetical protein
MTRRIRTANGHVYLKPDKTLEQLLKEWRDQHNAKFSSNYHIANRVVEPMSDTRATVACVFG